MLERAEKEASEILEPGIVGSVDVETNRIDVGGPWEVLYYWARSFPEDRHRVSTLSSAGVWSSAPNGLVVQADYSYADAPTYKVLVFPVGQSTRTQLHDHEQHDWVRRQRTEVPLMISVCTVALVYAAAGLLKGLPATTHWRFLGLLRDLDPTIDVRADERFVDVEDIITSAGIDMALHMVKRLADKERTREVRRAVSALAGGIARVEAVNCLSGAQ